MFEAKVGQTNNMLQSQEDLHYQKLKDMQTRQAKRFLDMQNVLAGSLAGPQQAVNKAENYTSTWTTNPDGGANGHVQ